MTDKQRNFIESIAEQLDIDPCDIKIIQKLIENGTSLVVVKKVGDNLLFGIAKQNIDIPKGKTIKI